VALRVVAAGAACQRSTAFAPHHRQPRDGVRFAENARLPVPARVEPPAPAGGHARDGTGRRAVPDEPSLETTMIDLLIGDVETVAEEARRRDPRDQARAHMLFVQGRRHAARGGDALDGMMFGEVKRRSKRRSGRSCAPEPEPTGRTRAMLGSRSTPTHSRPRDAAIRPTVPAPAKGSRTAPRFLLPRARPDHGLRIASQMLSGRERGSGSIQHSVAPRGRTT